MRYEAKNGKTNNEISNGNGTEKYKYDQFAVDDDQNGGLGSEKSDTGVKMERSLGLISGTAIIAGTMIGTILHLSF